MIIARPSAMNIARRNGRAIDQKVGRRSSLASSSGMSSFSRLTSSASTSFASTGSIAASPEVSWSCARCRRRPRPPCRCDRWRRATRSGRRRASPRRPARPRRPRRSRPAAVRATSWNGSSASVLDGRRAAARVTVRSAIVGEAGPPSDVEDRGVRQVLPHAPHDLDLERRVHRGEGVVEDEHTRMGHERTGQ